MRKEVKIGLAGIGALLILFFGINYLKGISMFKPESYYHVEFTNINGLSKSSPIYSNGFKIGIVHDISYNYANPGHILVGIDIDRNIRIPKGSHAELVTDMLGNIKMNLQMDTSASEYHIPNDTIPGTANEGIMGRAEKQLLPQMEKMMPKIDSILTSLNQLLADSAARNTLRNAEQLTARLNASSIHLQNLLANDIPQLTQNANAVALNLRQISDNLKGVDYAATFVKIDSTLHNVQLMTQKLNRKDNSMGLLLNDSSLYNNLNATAGNAATLLKDLQEHPKRYVHFSLFGRKDK